uniref:Ataxin-10 n=2 Tax=Anas platyrhynchos TaxID=8839 RepID=A0A493STM6_ANAPP
MAAAGSGSRSLLAAAARLGCSMAAAPAARLESVRALTGLLREAQHREMAQESIFQDLLKILTKALNEIEQASKDSCELLDLDTCLLLVAECFRCLRNACVECAKNQDVMRNLGLITTSVHLIKLLDGIEIKGEPLLTAFHCSLQFLGNIAAGNGDSQNSIWKCAFPDLFLVTLLELIMSKVSEKNSVTSEETNVFMRIADFLASCFRDKCETVLKLTSAGDAEDEEALVTVRLLDVLCEMTSNNGQLEHLQALPGLLETAIDTLRLTHLAGKQAVNIFTATHAMTGQEEISHPAVGFKSHLIRLIGNLCYKSKENQDKVYELDGIPLILDNCSIDDNNPFVNQWAVYAIRNLTEQNERNQELIARMEEKGLADNSVLERMGLEVEKQDDKLLLRSVRKKPS